MRPKKSPQEKKRLSLEKDRRNAFGESDKASRKAIPRRKAGVNRANRRLDSTSLAAAVGTPVDEVDEAIEQRLLGRRRKVWRKWPDQRLGKVLDRKRGERDTDDEQDRRRSS
jgi:hypothetical protein